jgi:hypothetical protein
MPLNFKPLASAALCAKYNDDATRSGTFPMADATRIFLLPDEHRPCFPSDGKEKYVQIERAGEMDT